MPSTALTNSVETILVDIRLTEIKKGNPKHSNAKCLGFPKVSEMRLELTRPNGHYPLKVARLPIPPPRQTFVFSWSEKRDSNPRPRPWQGRALPTELFSHYFRFTNAVVPRLVPRFVVCVAKVGIIFELASVLEENFHKKCFQSRFGGFLGLTKVFYLVISEVNPYLCGVGSWQQ